LLLTNIPDGERAFIDSNIFLYDFANDPVLGPPCTDFLRRVVRREVEDFTSTAIISEHITRWVTAEVTHRVMCSEAIRVHGLTPRTVVAALKSQPDLVKTLPEHLTVADRIVAMNVTILP
jgi:predicted nucleic acid-binding protein